MNMESEMIEDGNIELKLPKKRPNKMVIKAAIIVLGIAIIAIGVGKSTLFKNKTTKIGFENIGELATQTANCTQLSVIENSRNLYGFKIPFTQSKYIYSYDVVIKAGLDFNDIEWEKNDDSIEVKLPEIKVLSNEIKLDSFKVYHEDESIFNQITLTENNDSMQELKEKAEKDAVANGLLENARENAENILKGFFYKEDSLKKLQIIFKDK